MRNYSDTMASAHHDEDEVQVMRAVVCPLMCNCCKAQLANNYRNESWWHWSGYFCIDICEGGGVFKAMASLFTHNWQNAQIRRKEAGIVFRKTMQMYLKHKEVCL